MQNFKAVFFDVDSTIYTHRIHDFPESTKYTLHELKKNGYKIGIATSRCQFETKNLPRFFHEFAFDAAIYDGGALITENGKVVTQYPLLKQQVLDLLAYTNKHNIPMRYSTLYGDYLNSECSWYIKDEFFKLYLNMPQVKAYEDEDIFNILIYPTEKQQIDDIQKLLQNASIVIHSHKTLEITARNIDKSIGVEIMANRWGITSDEIICFGDGANDVGMLTYAGMGIAMENGNQKAKDAGDRICKHIDEDGVYHMCKALHLI